MSMIDSCKVCSAKPLRTNKGISCQICGQVFHVACIDNIDSAFRNFLSKNDFNSWKCNLCEENFRTLNNENIRLNRENSRLANENEQLRRRLDDLETQFSSIKNELKREILEELRNDSPTPPPNINNASLNEQVLACLREEKDRDKRRLNLCLRNFPESDSTSNDRTRVIELFKSKLGVNETELNNGVRNVKRVGAQSDDRPRIIIIECSNADLKRTLLQNSFKFKNVIMSNNKIFLTPDLTKQQLEADRALRETLRFRRNNGENVSIRKGKIVVNTTYPGSYNPPRPNPSQPLPANPIVNPTNV